MDVQRRFDQRVRTDLVAYLFDLDGVLTRTATLHASAWAEMFDAFLRERAEQTGEPFRPFTPADYRATVDGKPRLDGVRSFLASRGISVAEGTPDDPPSASTVHGLGRRKNDLVLALIHDRGVDTYGGSIRFVEVARDAGIRCAVVTSSKNCDDVLEAAGIGHLFDVRIDGVVAERDGLAGKPAPDTFLAGARALGTDAAHSAVFEDALAGVAAGRAGSFAWVVGVDRVGARDALLAHGADVVVGDLGELLAAP